MDRKQIKKLMEGNTSESCDFPEWIGCSEDMKLVIGVLHNIGKDASLQEFKEELERAEDEKFKRNDPNMNRNTNPTYNRNINW